MSNPLRSIVCHGVVDTLIFEDYQWNTDARFAAENTLCARHRALFVLPKALFGLPRALPKLLRAAWDIKESVGDGETGLNARVPRSDSPPHVPVSRVPAGEYGREAPSSILKPMERRKLRRTYNTPGDAHEFTWSCYRRQPFLKNQKTCTWLVEAIEQARVKHDFELWAYVFMPNHVHLIIHPRQENYDVAVIRQAIKQSVSQRAVAHLKKFNPTGLERMKVVDKNGSIVYRFWQDGGGYDRNLFSPKALRTAIDYIHNNPVRRGLVESALDWKWSSVRAYQGMDHGPLHVDICEMVL